MQTRCGWFYDCIFDVVTNDSVKARENNARPGVIVNLKTARLAGYGEEILGVAAPVYSSEVLTEPVTHVPAGMTQT